MITPRHATGCVGGVFVWRAGGLSNPRPQSWQVWGRLFAHVSVSISKRDIPFDNNEIRPHTKALVITRDRPVLLPSAT